MQIWSPISSKLGEKVLKECASTVRPCLLEALKSGTMNLDDYVDIVASICRTPGGEEMVRPTHDYLFVCSCSLLSFEMLNETFSK